MTKTIVLAVQQVESWGGVAEWNLRAAEAILEAGHNVVVLGSGDLLEQRLTAVGASFIHVDWSTWKDSLDEIAKRVALSSPSLICGHSPEGRKLAIALGNILSISKYVMLHGAYHDYMWSWEKDVDKVIAASGALVDFALQVGRVPADKIIEVPNGIDDTVFGWDSLSLSDRLRTGTGTIVTASRLHKDRSDQREVVIESARFLASMYPDVQWEVSVYGDGPMRDSFEFSYRFGFAQLTNVRLNMCGWISPDEVLTQMRTAVLAVGSGRAAAGAIAAGTLCAAVGARSNLGLVDQSTMPTAMWSNFGDHHGLGSLKKDSLAAVLTHAFSSNYYDEITSDCRERLYLDRRQSKVDEQMLDAFGLLED